MKSRPSSLGRQPGERLEPCHDCNGEGAGCPTCMGCGWLYVGQPEPNPLPASGEPAVRIVSARCTGCGYVNDRPNPRPYAPDDLRVPTRHGGTDGCRAIMLFETVPA